MKKLKNNKGGRKEGIESCNQMKEKTELEISSDNHIRRLKYHLGSSSLCL